jgi:phosphoglycolate phosphatase
MRVSARGVLIDLDGTLLDTVPDLAAAVNAMRADLGRAPLPVKQVAAYVGKGADVLVHRALTEALDGRAEPAEFQRGRESFFGHYRRENGRQALVFPGVRDAIALLRERGLALACVTNKPREFTVELLLRVGLSGFDAIVTGDDTTEKKPHPEPMLHACRLLRVRPDEAAMIGDSENDVLSARAAGCRVIVVETGYNEGRPVGDLDADAIVPALLDAARLIEPLHASSQVNETTRDESR